MNSRSGNSLIVIEGGQLETYILDDKNTWKIGRASKDSDPDIVLKMATVSRKHGRIENKGGVWFYIDEFGKNGTVYNKKHISKGKSGRIKPVLLENGDILVFGGGENEVVNFKTVWATYISREFIENWRTVDTKGSNTFEVVSSEGMVKLEQPKKGTVIDKKSGMVIYMGDLTYLVGDIEIKMIE